MRGHGGETILLVAECRIARPRQRGLLESAIRERAVNPHEPVGLGKSERPRKSVLIVEKRTVLAPMPMASAPTARAV